jgi:hypothetical protein
MLKTSYQIFNSLKQEQTKLEKIALDPEVSFEESCKALQALIYINAQLNSNDSSIYSKTFRTKIINPMLTIAIQKKNYSFFDIVAMKMSHQPMFGNEEVKALFKPMAIKFLNERCIWNFGVKMHFTDIHSVFVVNSNGSCCIASTTAIDRFISSYPLKELAFDPDFVALSRQHKYFLEKVYEERIFFYLISPILEEEVSVCVESSDQPLDLSIKPPSARIGGVDMQHRAQHFNNQIEHFGVLRVFRPSEPPLERHSELLSEETPSAIPSARPSEPPSERPSEEKPFEKSLKGTRCLPEQLTIEVQLGAAGPIGLPPTDENFEMIMFDNAFASKLQNK